MASLLLRYVRYFPELTYLFLIIALFYSWESLKDIGSPAYQCAPFVARLTLGLLNAYVLNLTSFITLLTICPYRDHNRRVEVQRVLPSNFVNLSLAANFCYINILLAETHTAFQLSKKFNIRLTILSGVTWNPIVFSSQFRWSIYCEQVKKTCSAVSLFSAAFWACFVYVVFILREICSITSMAY